MSTANRRALHFVFKVANRKETTKFYRDVLGMKILRHEEFEEGCKASCNGPYDGKWSKSMVGYGAEDNHFVVELTYNYGIGSYKLGTDFQGMYIDSKSVLGNAVRHGWPVREEGGTHVLEAPGGYKYHVTDTQPTRDPVQKVRLACSNLDKSVGYWNGLLGMKMYSRGTETATLGYGDDQAKLELVQIQEAVDHATAFGRIAFSCPEEQLPDIERKVQEAEGKILTPLVSLDTPGKATVQVVILADPDGHEICFVGDEAFRELSQVDPQAEDLLQKALAADKSDEWFAKKGKSKATA